MADRKPDISHLEETGTRNEEKHSESTNLIPEDFFEEDAIPSIYLEDLEGDREVWLVECPIMVDPNKLLGKQLHFNHETSFKIDEERNEKCVAIPTREDGNVVCLLSSCTGQSIKTVALQSAGKISLNINYDVPDLGSMIPEDTNVPLPEGLKMRHPFLGPKYKEIVKLMGYVKKRVFENGNEDSQEELLGKKRKKRISINENNLTNISFKKEGNYLDSNEKKLTTVEGVEYFSQKKAKKKKQSYYKDDGITTTDSQEELEGGYSNIINTRNVSIVKNEEFLSPKKTKKRKWESLYEDPVKEESQEEIEIINNDNHHVSKKLKEEKVSKKLKKEKRDVIDSGGEYSSSNMVTRVSMAGAEVEILSPKKKKKKRDSQYKDDSIATEGSQEELTVTYDSEERTSKKVKKKNKQDLQYKGDNIATKDSQEVTYDGSKQMLKKIKKEKRGSMPTIQGHFSEEEVDNKQGIMYEESKKASKKMKKRHTMDSANIVNISMVSEGLGLTPKEDIVVVQDFRRKSEKKQKKHSLMAEVSTTNSIVKDEINSGDDILVKSPGSKKKKSIASLGNEMQLLSPKKERKIKHEHLERVVYLVGDNLIDTSTEKKRKKDKKKTSHPENIT